MSKDDFQNMKDYFQQLKDKRWNIKCKIMTKSCIICWYIMRKKEQKTNENGQKWPKNRQKMTFFDLIMSNSMGN